MKILDFPSNGFLEDSTCIVLISSIVICELSEINISSSLPNTRTSGCRYLEILIHCKHVLQGLSVFKQLTACANSIANVNLPKCFWPDNKYA